MADPKPPLEQLVDLLVYAPVGMALTVRDAMPEIVAKGRARVTGQVALAKMVGQFAVAQGQKEAGKLSERLVTQATEVVANLARRGADPFAGEQAAGEHAATGAAGGGVVPPFSDQAASNGHGPAASEVGKASPAGRSATARARPGSARDLAIPGYDTLSASQVVQRLAGLSAAELDAVRVYEAGTRGRRTILNRVAQLQADRAG